jgi:hypothetical protein
VGVCNKRYAFWAGGTLEDAANGTAKFIVGHGGGLKATGVDISGTIKADSGYIGGTETWTVEEGKIHSYNGPSDAT